MVRPRAEHRKDWPEGLREPRPGYYTFRRGGGTEVAIGRISLERAIVAAEELLYMRIRELPELSESEVSKMKRTAYQRAKTRARLFSRQMLTPEEYDSIWARAGMRCEITRIPLQPRPKDAGAGVFPWAASIDRIDRLKGYEAGNCRVVCAAVNLALNQFGEEVFAEITHSLYIAR